SGLLLGSGPCLATCGPVLISYVAAVNRNTKENILVWFIFSLSRIFTYLILGLAIFLLGELLVRQNLVNIAQYIYIGAGAIIVLIGLVIILKNHAMQHGPCRNLLDRLISYSFKIHPFTLGLIMGMMPCAPLLAVLSYVGLISTSWHECIFYSAVFGLATLISPLILLILAAGFISRILQNKPKIYRILRIFCGLIIILLGLELFFRGLSRVTIF
ncbi:MAG: sulfite exporter TauE/SafE family protein, partial [Candidatus Omnitrophica bacterium]|nr:sulfite exporter TauE/SafE family protein [Candidatus Omnitrophota bacterium]